MWRCPKCGEEIEDQFDACWNCLTARGPADATIASGPALALWLVLGSRGIVGLVSRIPRQPPPERDPGEASDAKK